MDNQLYRILLVDDVPAVRESLRWAFEEMSHIQIVGEASNGLEALQLATTLQPHLVILDIELPGLNGYQVARQLKATRPETFIIFLTVHNQPECRRQATEIGVDGFVEKSAGWPTLMLKIAELFSTPKHRP